MGYIQKVYIPVRFKPELAIQRVEKEQNEWIQQRIAEGYSF